MTWTHADPKGITGPIPEMMLAAILGVVMAVYSLTLPNTPPATGAKSDPLAFRKAFSLFKTVPGFGVFMLISFFAATEFMFFYGLSGQFLESKTIPHILIPVTKSISQFTEIGALAALLPLWLPRKGMKWCLLVGSFAWPLRYLIFALGQPMWLVVLSLGLHGFGYAFVMVVQQLYVDRVSPKDVRASAQSLLTFVTLGLGNVIGSFFSGWVQQHFTHNGVTEWAPVFILPTITTLACAFAYMFTFKEPETSAVVINSDAPVPV
jgi:MFS family permease